MSLGEFLTLKRGYDLPSSMRVDGHVPVVSSSGITGYHNVAKVEGPGVATGRYGTLGEAFFVADSFWPLNTSLYIHDFKGNNPKFTAYFLKTVLTKRSSDKAAVPGVNRNDLHRLSVRVTRDTSKQRTIASILSAYDDLIKNNKRRIRLLERTARLLYDEWFVYLRFPGHERVIINNGVPEGWERIHLSKLVTTQYGFTESATEEPTGSKFLRGMDINKTSYINWNTVPFCSESKFDFGKYALNVDDIVVTRMADPGRVAIVETEQRAVFASYLVRLSRKTNVSIPALYLFYVLSDDAYQGFISGASSGSTRKSANAKLLVDFYISVPTPQLVTSFVEQVQPLRLQIQKLLQQNAASGHARDATLPRLINGEIAV